MKQLTIPRYSITGTLGHTFMVSYQLRREMAPAVFFEAFCTLSSSKIITWSFTVMPNQAHLLFSLPEAMPLNLDLPNDLNDLLLSCFQNKLIDTPSSSFWLTDCRFVMSTSTFYQLLNFTIQAPVKAGLTGHWLNWEWSYLNPYYP